MGKIIVPLPDEIHQKLKHLKADNNKHLKDMVIEAVSDYVDKHGKKES
jgi:predicted transcriptional regulator